MADSEQNIPNHMRWNDTQSHCDTDRCIHWLFESQVECAPDAIAVDDGRSVLSYSELNARANQLANFLAGDGVGPGSLVGICMTRSVDLIVALLGVLKAGGAYVPIEPAWPDRRISLMVEELQIESLVIDPNEIGRPARLDNRKLEIVCIQDGRVGAVCAHQIEGSEVSAVSAIAWCDGLATTNPSHVSDPDDRAYVIFTSGSTGAPKAVAVRHRPVINLIDWVTRMYGVGRADRILFSTSIAFDLSVYDVFGVLAAGGAIRVASTEELHDPSLMAEILRRGEITFWDSAPAVLERILPILQFVEGHKRLRLVFLSGDWVPLSLPSHIKRLFPASRLIVLGGATEATVWSNFYEAGDIDPAWKSIPYGRPIQNVQYFILDPEMWPCADGVAGDLYIGGACLADGYVNDAELTGRRFILHPLARGGRLYRTGDRARYLPDGNIEFLGRADRQIKIRGYRIEPAEIEAALQRHPAVRRAAVIARGEGSGRQRLVAYIASDDIAEPAALSVQLLESLRREMPRYMIPAEIIVLPELPLKASGKVDLAILSATPPAPHCRSAWQEPARTEVHRKLAALWCRIFRLESVGINESFFALGGDSLQTVEMIAAAAGVGLNLRMEDLHRHPTIGELAAMCDGTHAPTNAAECSGEIPLTPIQHWFFERSLESPGRYNTVFTLDVMRSLQVGGLRRAIQFLQTHHAALRLRFKQIGPRWVQSLAPQVNAPEVIGWNLSSLHSAHHRDEIERRLASLRRKMDLLRDPLIKAILIERGGGHRPQVLLLCHHLVIDAVSIRVIVEDLNTVLGQIDRDEALHVPRSSSYAAWANRLSEFAGSIDIAAEGGYWLHLPWNEARPLPRDFPADDNNYGSSRIARAALSRGETEILQRRLPRRLGASIGELLLAVVVRTLSHWSRRQTVQVDLTVHGRHPSFSDISLSRTVGYITSNVPIVITVPNDASIEEAAQIVHEHVCRLPRGGVGYGILRYLAPLNHAVESLRRCPEAEVKFNYLGSMSTETADSNHLRLVPAAYPGVLDPREKRAYLHNLELSIIDHKLQIEWKYSEALHRADSIHTLLGRFTSALRGLIHDGAGDLQIAAASSNVRGRR